jgi:hypothetical protein
MFYDLNGGLNLNVERGTSRAFVDGARTESSRNVWSRPMKTRSGKGRVRERKHLKRLCKKLGVCRICALMLPHEQGEHATPVRANCPACGRVVAFDLNVETAFGTFLRCQNLTGDLCAEGYTIELDGVTQREKECGCDREHAVFQFITQPGA